MITSFDDLSDLSLIEIFSYLSCVDALWAFSKLNIRLTALLFERGFHHYVDLSSARYYQFQNFLSILQLNEIRSLVIDCYASPLQLKKWPYLPRLEILRLKGIYDYVHICNFIWQHASTLTQLAVESTIYDRRVSASKNNLKETDYNLCYNQ